MYLRWNLNCDVQRCVNVLFRYIFVYCRVTAIVWCTILFHWLLATFSCRSWIWACHGILNLSQLLCTKCCQTPSLCWYVFGTSCCMFVVICVIHVIKAQCSLIHCACVFDVAVNCGVVCCSLYVETRPCFMIQLSDPSRSGTQMSSSAASTGSCLALLDIVL